jgi:hypothetical protein
MISYGVYFYSDAETYLVISGKSKQLIGASAPEEAGTFDGFVMRTTLMGFT